MTLALLGSWCEADGNFTKKTLAEDEALLAMLEEKRSTTDAECQQGHRG